ncbi:MAG: arsenate reductase ArsC [Actinobacteria bacterium]|nr:arsenate reductase ArsC [Actinomycetota bacterium]
MKKVIVICTGNSIRSQIAEGFFKKYKSSWEIESAGTNPKGLNPMAVKVMMEKGIDISDQKSKNLKQFINSKFDDVITVCDNARESCPLFPGKAKLIHWNFEDPAEAKGSIDEKLVVFRKVRDAIEEKILEFLKNDKS